MKLRGGRIYGTENEKKKVKEAKVVGNFRSMKIETRAMERETKKM